MSTVKRFHDLFLQRRKDFPNETAAEAAIAVAAANPDLDQARLVELRGLPVEHAASRGLPTQVHELGAAAQFHALVERRQKDYPRKSWADCCIEVGRENPSLEERRRLELSAPIGPGGILMTSV